MRSQIDGFTPAFFKRKEIKFYSRLKIKFSSKFFLLLLKKRINPGKKNGENLLIKKIKNIYKVYVIYDV